MGAPRGARAPLQKKRKKRKKGKRRKKEEGKGKEGKKEKKGGKKKKKRLCWLETRAPRGARAPLPPEKRKQKKKIE